MEIVLALALGLVSGLVIGFAGGAYFAIRMYARRVKFEMNAGHIDRTIAERLADMGNMPDYQRAARR